VAPGDILIGELDVIVEIASDGQGGLANLLTQTRPAVSREDKLYHKIAIKRRSVNRQ
jgi:hypothetical protein